MFIVSSILTPDHSLVILKLRGHQNLLEVCKNPGPQFSPQSFLFRECGRGP